MDWALKVDSTNSDRWKKLGRGVLVGRETMSKGRATFKGLEVALVD